MGNNPNIVFVPIKIGRIVFGTKGASPHLVRATLLKETSHSLNVAFTILDNEENTIAVVKEARFRAIPLNKTRQENLELLDYHGIPKPHPWTLTPAPLNPETLHTRMADMVAGHFKSKVDCQYAEEIEPLLDSLCRQFVFETLHQLVRNGTVLSRKCIQGLQMDTPEIAPFIHYLIREAETDQTLSLKGSDWIIRPYREGEETAREIWNILVSDYPDFFSIIDMAGRVGLHLPSILTGKKDVRGYYFTPARIFCTDPSVTGDRPQTQTGPDHSGNDPPVTGHPSDGAALFCHGDRPYRSVVCQRCVPGDGHEPVRLYLCCRHHRALETISF